MLKNNIPAKTENIEYFRLQSSGKYLQIWVRWDNHLDDKFAWVCEETDFRKLAALYLWTWFVQDIVKATYWRLLRRIHAINGFR